MKNNEQQHAKISAFMWTREFICERLQKIQRSQHHWEWLFKQPGDQGHYAAFNGLVLLVGVLFPQWPLLAAMYSYP
jgi:hypothetical protein